MSVASRESLDGGRPRRPRVLAAAVIVSAALCGAGLAGTLYRYRAERAAALAQAKEHARREIRRARSTIEAELRKSMATNLAMVTYMEAAPRSTADIRARLEVVARANPQLRGIGIAYDAGPHDRALFAPYLVRDHGHLKQRDLGRNYTGEDFFRLPMDQRRPTWQEPHYGAATGRWIANYTAPFFEPDHAGGDAPRGVVFTTLALEDYQDILQRLSLGRTGYGILLSPNGTFIAHPSADYVTMRKTIFDLAREQDQPALEQMGREALAGHGGYVDYVDAFSGQATWMFYEPIPAAGWTLGVEFFTSEIAPLSTLERRWHPYIVVQATLFGLLLASVLVALRTAWFVRSPWPVTIAVSLVLLACTVMLIHIGRVHVHDVLQGSTLLLDRHGVNRAIELHEERREQRREEAPIYRPTGLYIQSIETDDGMAVLLTGYLWQRVPRGAGVPRGFTFPDAIELEVSELYERPAGDEVVIGWRFSARLRHDLGGWLYPFGEETVRLRIWPADPTRNVMLVPDLAAYGVTNPRALPGVDRDCITPGWKRLRSFFGLRGQHHETSFGAPGPVGAEKRWELVFAIAMQREISNVLVAQLVPLVVVCASLFGLLLSITSSSEKSGSMGFDFGMIMAGTSTLFFGLVLANAQLREQVNRATFIEDLYFISYFMMLAVTLDAALVAQGIAPRLLRYRDNQIPRLLFWPVLMVLVCCVAWRHLG